MYLTVGNSRLEERYFEHTTYYVRPVRRCEISVNKVFQASQKKLPKALLETES